MRMVEEKGIEVRAVEALGKGFDLSSDFRLKFAKGLDGNEGRLVVLNEDGKRDVVIPSTSGVVVHGVPVDIHCDKGDRIRFKSDVLEFNQMSDLLNQKSSVQGKIPSGYMNSIFDFTGDWLQDITETKYLAFDGFFISLYNLHLTASPLILQSQVQKSVPARWDPAALSRFIRSYGTHIIVGMAIGGQDLLCVRQKSSSPVPPADLRRHLEDLGDYMFSDGPSLLRVKTRNGKQNIPEVFDRILQSNTMHLTTISVTSSKDGLTIVCSKRGGDVYLKSHSNWLQTVLAEPDAILFKFVPITSLLTGIPGSGYLSHAINLYLRYKPDADDLQHFLEFQVPRQWAPMFCDLPLTHQRKRASSPSLQFSFMGPMICVSSMQVSTSQKPVVGLRLYLEGKKCNRLAIHVQHLSSLPNTMDHSLANTSTTRPSWWRGSDDIESSGEFLEPINWKRYSSICSSVVKHDPNWLKGDQSGVYIVTGAQLLSKGKWPKTILHLRLHYTFLPNCAIRKTEWAGSPEPSHKSTFLTNLSTTFTFTQKASTDQQKQDPAALNSGVYPEGPPVLNRASKLLKFVDLAEVVKGPHDAPGHWLVTAAKLVKEGHRIGLHVKFALLDYW